MTLYAFVSESELKETRLPKVAQTLEGGDWVMNLHDAPQEVKEACGYFEVVEDEQPPIKSNQYLERNLTMRYEKPVIEWKRRVKKLDDQIVETKQTLKKREKDGIAPALKKLEAAPRLQSMGEMRDTIQALSLVVKALAEERFPDA